jgi:hypothetical protein
MGIWYDEANNKICLVRCQGTTANIYYRQGTANSDGTITWDSAEVQVCTDAGYDAVVCKDSNGYPWIAYYKYNAFVLYVVKASTTNGSSWGTPYALWTSVSANSEIGLVPLTNGRMLAIKAYVGTQLKSKLYDGSSWGSEVGVSSSNIQDTARWDLAADGDNVHLVFIKQTSYDVVYIKYTYSSGWGTEETVESSTVDQAQPAVSFKSTNKVRVFYFLSQTTIKYRDRDDGSWQTAVTISSSESTMTCLTSSYQEFSDKICVTWKSGASSPYNVNFEGYALGGAIVKEVTDSLSLSEALLRNKTLAISDSVGFADTLLRGKIFQILDSVNLAETIFRDKNFMVTDSVSLSEIVEVVIGIIIKYVADMIGLTEQIKLDKTFIVSDAMNLFDQASRHKPSVTITDVIGLSDNAYVSKILMISDQTALVETVEKGVGGMVRTRVFLVLGDLAIQVCGV